MKIVIAPHAFKGGLRAMEAALIPGGVEHGITDVEAATTESMPLQEAMMRAYELVRAAAARAVQRWSGLRS